jgi:hypothetical protein
VTLAVEAGSHLVEVLRHGMKRMIGDHHPLGESVFVNHSHANLTSQYGLADPEVPSTAPDSASS